MGHTGTLSRQLEHQPIEVISFDMALNWDGGTHETLIFFEDDEIYFTSMPIL